MMLYRVISSSTVCLMSHDRQQTLQLIDQMAYRLTLSPPSLPTLSQQGGNPRVSLLYFTSNQWIQVV